MIAVSSLEGSLLKVLSSSEVKDGAYGFHSLFGFISENAAKERLKLRRHRGLKTTGDWLCRFQVQGSKVAALEGCSIESAESSWKLLTSFGQFMLSSAAASTVDIAVQAPEEKDRKWTVLIGILAILLMFIVLFFSPYEQQETVAPKILEPLAVKIIPEKQQAVVVPNAMSVPKEMQTATHETKRAIQQNLGFLGLLGRKDLKKALGGAPTSIAQASAGAGAGGMEGSGGELLVGLGQGVKRTTVGNSGVAGLGGIGTKGAGGGAGGYGNSMIGSGEGKALSSVPLSQDMVLEGGLDKAVIQATIAKYLSQVRACYEDGLRKTPGLSGQVTMNFEIGASGALNFAKVARSSLGNAPVENCIANRMMGWKFPKPLGGVNVKVNYPFMLRPVGS